MWRQILSHECGIRSTAPRQQQFGERAIDLLDADCTHADVVIARGLAVIVRADAWRAGEARINFLRGSERLVEFRRFRAEQHNGRQPRRGREMGRPGIVADHRRRIGIERRQLNERGLACERKTSRAAGRRQRLGLGLFLGRAGQRAR